MTLKELKHCHIVKLRNGKYGAKMVSEGNMYNIH